MPESNTDRARYPSHRSQVKNARRRAERVAREWGLSDEVVSDVVLVVDELVANAVTHAHVPRGREVGVTLRLLDTVVRVEVRDADSRLPAPCTAQILTDSPDTQEVAEDGRGLLLVELLCQRWGSSEEVIGKIIWAEIPVTSAQELACALPHPQDAAQTRPACTTSTEAEAES